MKQAILVIRLTITSIESNSALVYHKRSFEGGNLTIKLSKINF